MTSRRTRLIAAGVLALMSVASAPGARRRGACRSDDLGPSLQPRADPLRARRDTGPHHALHDPLRAPRRPREADAREDHGAQPGRVVDRVARRTRLRVRAAQGGDVPQRRARHGRRRQVLVRAVPRHLREGAQGEGGRDRDSGCPARPVPAQATMAGLHGVLRHAGNGRGLDRPQEVRREGRGGRLQEGAGRSRPLQVRLVHARDRARAGGLRGILAQDAGREAPGLQGGPRRHSRDWPCSSAARWTSPTRSPASSARRCGARPGSRCGRLRSWPPTGWSSPTSGIRALRGTTGACASRPIMPSTARRSTRP